MLPVALKGSIWLSPSSPTFLGDCSSCVLGALNQHVWLCVW